MSRATVWRSEHWRPTPLNIATSAAYAACAGRHRASRRTVLREFPIGTRELPVCEACDVPIVSGSTVYGASVTVKALLEGGLG